MVYKVISALFWFQDNHCKESFEEDIKFTREVLKHVDDNS